MAAWEVLTTPVRTIDVTYVNRCQQMKLVLSVVVRCNEGNKMPQNVFILQINNLSNMTSVALEFQSYLYTVMCA